MRTNLWMCVCVRARVCICVLVDAYLVDTNTHVITHLSIISVKISKD